MKDEILRLRLEGRTYKQIQETLGCSLSTISYHCGPGQKEKLKNRSRDRTNTKKKYLRDFKNGKPCTDCGEFYPSFVLDFDHLGDKVANVTTMAHQLLYSLDDLKKEIAKCELVCANCHRFRTWKRSLVSGSDTDIPDDFGE